MQPAEADPYLYSKIVNRLNAAKPDLAPSKLVWIAAGSLVILMVLNLIAINYAQSANAHNGNDLQALSGQFQLINQSSINYN